MLSTYRVHNDEYHDRLVGRFDGVVEMLAALRGRGYRLGVVTSKREQPARHGLRRDGLEPLFDDAVFHDDTERHKPHPEPLLLAARRAAVPPHAVVYVGDSIHDIVAGRAAGMRTIAAGWGPFARDVLERERPDAIADSPAAVLGILEQLRIDR
jgi:pyrophosphatase PpaX